MKGSDITGGERALNDLISAIIVQAAMDYVDARRAGLITKGGDVDEPALRRMMFCNYSSRAPLPKWMEPSDVFSCVWFLYSEAMLDLMPHKWSVNPDAIRTAVAAAAESDSNNINHHLAAKL